MKTAVQPVLEASKPVPPRAGTRAPVAPALMLEAQAVVFDGDSTARLETLKLTEPDEDDVVVDVEVSGISTGTEKLFWSGAMPPFPGMGYPLVPGYETVGRVVEAPTGSNLAGQRVFVPGARCYEQAHGLFGGAASRVVAPQSKVFAISDLRPEEGLLLSLAATAYHAIGEGQPPDLIVGFGVLGRLIRRIVIANGHPPPTVWEIDPARADAEGIKALNADTDPRRDYKVICDASGCDSIIDQLISRLTSRGELVLAGFYPGRIGFDFAPAFMKEARLRIAAEWDRGDLQALMDLVTNGDLSLAGLVTHAASPDEAASAYQTAFQDTRCLKMLLDWRVPRG